MRKRRSYFKTISLCKDQPVQSNQDLLCKEYILLCPTILKFDKEQILSFKTRHLYRKDIINPFMPSGLFYLNSLNQSISILSDVFSFYYYHVLMKCL